MAPPTSRLAAIVEPAGSYGLREAGERVGLFFVDVKQLIQTRDNEDFVNLRPQIAQLELAAQVACFLIEDDELIESCTREKFDLAEI